MAHTTSRRFGVLALLAVLCFAAPAGAEELGEWDAVSRAFENNPSLQAGVLQTSAAREALDAAEHERTPVLRAGLGGGYSSPLESDPDQSGDLSLDLGFNWTSSVGTAIDIGVVGSWAAPGSGGDPTDTNVDGSGSTYGAQAQVQLTQPLLRGAGRDVGEASVRSARLSVTSAEHSQDAAASQLISDVITAYWELWYAQESLEVNRESLAVSQRQLDEARTRANTLGTIAGNEVLRFESDLASIEESLAAAESEVRTRSAELGRLMGMSSTEAAALRASAAAPAHDLQITADEAIELARAQSSDLLAARTELAAAQDRVEVARDATLPRLDLTTTLSLGGLWSDQTGTGGSYAQPGDGMDFGSMVGLSLELPISNGRARAQLSETRIRSEAAELDLEAREQQVETQAATGVERLETARRRIALAERSEGLARQLAQAEAEALRLGTSTAFQALEAQSTLRQTELRRLRSLVDQAESAISLQHLTGTLLAAYSETAR
jgi:outer membrane protein